MNNKIIRKICKLFSVMILFISVSMVQSPERPNNKSDSEQNNTMTETGVIPDTGVLVFTLTPGEMITLEVKTESLVHWEVSGEEIDWKALPGATYNNIRITADSEKYYRAVSFPKNCDPVISRTVFIDIKDPLPTYQPQPIGILKPFWRNYPALGPYLQGGNGLFKIPEYFSQTDFPYRKRPYEREALFADHLSIVRLLGGHSVFPGLNLKNDLGTNNKLDATDTVAIKKLSQYDFVYRNPDGSLGFRPELIEERLEPYIQNGYESFTIVLDDIPYALTGQPKFGTFGQVGPPDDPDEWHETVRQLCITLSGILGFEKANNLRFRLGTEMNETKRFAGTEDQFISHFDYAAAAINDVLPGAGLTPFNITKANLGSIPNHNVNVFNVIEHASIGINRKTGAPNKPVSIVAASRYFYEGDNLNNIVGGIDNVWNFISKDIPGNNNFAREIHEFGASADWSSVPSTNNPDAFGNAMTLRVTIGLLSNGIDKIFHWANYDKKLLIPSSILWGYTVLDYMQGGNSFIVKPACNNAHIKTILSGLLSVFDEKAYLLINSFNPDRTIHQINEVTIRIPKDVLPFSLKNMQTASMNNENCIYQSLRKGLELAGNLKPEVVEKKEWTAGVLGMSIDQTAAQQMVSENWDYYISKWKSALMLGNFSGSLRENNDDYYIKLNISSPESIVILLEN